MQRANSTVRERGLTPPPHLWLHAPPVSRNKGLCCRLILTQVKDVSNASWMRARDEPCAQGVDATLGARRARSRGLVSTQEPDLSLPPSLPPSLSLPLSLFLSPACQVGLHLEALEVSWTRCACPESLDKRRWSLGNLDALGVWDTRPASLASSPETLAQRHEAIFSGHWHASDLDTRHASSCPGLYRIANSGLLIARPDRMRHQPETRNPTVLDPDTKCTLHAFAMHISCPLVSKIVLLVSRVGSNCQLHIFDRSPGSHKASARNPVSNCSCPELYRIACVQGCIELPTTHL